MDALSTMYPVPEIQEYGIHDPVRYTQVLRGRPFGIERLPNLLNILPPRIMKKMADWI